MENFMGPMKNDKDSKYWKHKRNGNNNKVLSKSDVLLLAETAKRKLLGILST